MQPHTPDSARQGGPTKAFQMIAGLVLGAACTKAPAADGCQILLCLAAPSWRAIPQCVPPVQEVLRDLARGRPFPTCNFVGNGAGSGHQGANPPGFCPPQYTHLLPTDAPVYLCDYAGAITVVVEGDWFTRTWWNFAGDTVTEFSPLARRRLGSWDTRFDDDYAAWLAALPPSSPIEGTP